MRLWGPGGAGAAVRGPRSKEATGTWNGWPRRKGVRGLGQGLPPASPPALPYAHAIVSHAHPVSDTTCAAPRPPALRGHWGF